MTDMYRYDAEQQQAALDAIAMANGAQPGDIPKDLYFHLGSRGEKVKGQWPEMSLEDRVSQVATMFGNYVNGNEDSPRHVITHGYECLCRTGYLTASAARADGKTVITDHDITYEGEDGSEMEAKWRETMQLPGQRVRFNENSLHSDPDSPPPFGNDPVSVKRAIVTSTSAPTDLNPEGLKYEKHYEFEGIEGRWNADQFMEEGGRESIQGVLSIENDAMWITPFAAEDINRFYEYGEVPYPDGASMRIGSFSENSSYELREDNLLPFSDSEAKPNTPGIKTPDDNFIPLSAFNGLMKDGVIANYDIQSQNGYGQDGPMRLLAISDIDHAPPALLDRHSQAIEKQINLETRDPILKLCDEMAVQSAAWRAEKENGAFSNDRTPRTTDTATATKIAQEEALYLMRGHNAGDANVRMAAAMIATEGRPTHDGLGVSTWKLADALVPEPVRSKGLGTSEPQRDLAAMLRQQIER